MAPAARAGTNAARNDTMHKGGDWSTSGNWQVKGGQSASPAAKATANKLGNKGMMGNQKASPLGNLDAPWLGGDQQMRMQQMQQMQQQEGQFTKVGGSKIDKQPPKPVKPKVDARAAAELKRER